jgi:hypothetical protein
MLYMVQLLEILLARVDTVILSQALCFTAIFFYFYSESLVKAVTGQQVSDIYAQ